MSELKRIGREYKQNFPFDYDEWTDEEVGQAVIDKAAEEGGDIALTSWDGAIASIARADTSLRDLMLTDSGLVDKIQSTFDFYDPRAGIFTGWLRKLRGNNRNELLEVLTREQELLIKQAATFEDQVREGKKKQVEYHLFIARNVSELAGLKAQAALNGQAFGSGMTVDHYSASNYEQKLSKIRQDEEDAKAERERRQEEARITRNLESAKAYKMNEYAITDDYRQKREKALIALDVIEARTDISDKTKAALKISKENEAENLRRIIETRERRAVADEESLL